MMGLWHTPLGLKVVTPFSMLFGCANGMASIAWWSSLDRHSFETYGQVWHSTQCLTSKGATLLLATPCTPTPPEYVCSLTTTAALPMWQTHQLAFTHHWLITSYGN